MRIQKGKVRFAKNELYNLDETLSPIIRTALTQFRDSKRHGFPMLVYEDYIAADKGITIEEAKQYIINAFEQSRNGTIEEYKCADMFQYFTDVILEKIIFAFSKHPEYQDVEPMPYDIRFELLESTFIEGFDDCKESVLHCIPKDGYTEDDITLYDERKKAYDEKLKKDIEYGRQLFIRYYDALWD